ncbi:MAG: hypothetical protein JWQ63_2285 [Mucilaginibacter sp.]|nr:hypothetical protein [Mucilaginibacter sp.]
MNKSKKIALIICYFGKLPWYFSYFVHSCKYNPSVDFYIITDDYTYTNPLPNNVKFIYKTLNEISLLATEKLGFEVSITNGYKLCDFKPAYGFIFSELIECYDFWGYCDIDVIFGNIRDFMTTELLENHDLISVRPDWIPGCFLLFKNDLKMNTLFLHSKDYKKVFESEKHYCFDETNFAHNAFEDGKSYLEIQTEIESMMHVVKKMEAQNYIKPFFDLYIIEGGRPGNLRWEDGKMIYKKRFEILLYHLIKFKKQYIPKRKINYIPNCFTISPTKIYHQTKSKIVINEF